MAARSASQTKSRPLLHNPMDDFKAILTSESAPEYLKWLQEHDPILHDYIDARSHAFDRLNDTVSRTSKAYVETATGVKQPFHLPESYLRIVAQILWEEYKNGRLPCLDHDGPPSDAEVKVMHTAVAFVTKQYIADLGLPLPTEIKRTYRLEKSSPLSVISEKGNPTDDSKGATGHGRKRRVKRGAEGKSGAHTKRKVPPTSDPGDGVLEAGADGVLMITEEYARGYIERAAMCHIPI
ncbi:hypothetical protein BAUCODRAFT_412585 [Baudoinia panamericana UAMH 10762]|uniref:Uncharacterized protein n=1 Tax=Baudoinia panamericana (strain UAMH 10762) TaxID=717646 RepID=M2N2E4_BAUPA|nr:uncharacterized protein BAUCODRAFT_412585 [Baudoinia panamericana UAMH 10762]EMC98088.1 hypothetical protein BAUCODRAFT_412585 [Baudoinia panamericana UAMH 10762]